MITTDTATIQTNTKYIKARIFLNDAPVKLVEIEVK